MPQEPIATLKVANEPEGNSSSWRDVAATPMAFLQWLIKRVAVDISKVKTLIPIYIGEPSPKGVEAGKIHFQDSDNPRIGISTRQGYKYFDRYPRNVILGWRGGASIPTFFTQVPPSEVEAMGLPASQEGSLVWVVYPE